MKMNNDSPEAEIDDIMDEVLVACIFTSVVYIIVPLSNLLVWTLWLFVILRVVYEV